MSDSFKNLADTSVSLARNPLGIIALFIVLVYGFASLVTVFASSFTSGERLPLIYFLIVFPVLVLGVFGWLVSKHSGKLFAPSDFKNEDNYVKMQMAVVASLGAATGKTQTPISKDEINQLIEIVRTALPASVQDADGWRNRILWVDDYPDNNTYERQAFEALGLRFTLAESTSEALEKLSRFKYVAIISDMGRREGPREGYVLLDQLRQQGDRTPLFFYAASSAPEHKIETREHGGQGCTDEPQELFEMVTKAVIEQQTVSS